MNFTLKAKLRDLSKNPYLKPLFRMKVVVKYDGLFNYSVIRYFPSTCNKLENIQGDIFFIYYLV